MLQPAAMLGQHKSARANERKKWNGFEYAHCVCNVCIHSSPYSIKLYHMKCASVCVHKYTVDYIYNHTYTRATEHSHLTCTYNICVYIQPANIYFLQFLLCTLSDEWWSNLNDVCNTIYCKYIFTSIGACLHIHMICECVCVCLSPSMCN